MQVFFSVSIHCRPQKAALIETRTAGSLGTRLVTSFSTCLSRTPKTPGKCVLGMRKSLVTLRFALYGCKNRPFFYIVATNRYKPRNRGYLEQVQ